MFHDIPPAVLARMRHLEAIDARDRGDGTPQSHRLRQIPPDTGRFLALLAVSAPVGPLLEIGTSAGYSTLWLTLAAAQRGDRVTTWEMAANKLELARETFREAGVEALVNLVPGDARHNLPALDGIAYCFLDAEKDVYHDCYDLIIPRLLPGGLLIADNVISHQEFLQPLVDRAYADDRVDAVVVPIGKGELVCRKI